MATATQPAAAASTAAQPQASPLPMPAKELVARMVASAPGVSDLILSPGRPPQVERSGKLTGVEIPQLEMLKPEHTARLAAEIIGTHKKPLESLKEDGACDLSYSVPGTGRFRVNIFQQRGTYAIVMRVIPDRIPGFDDLNLPAELKKIAELKNGIVLVTGPTGSGKSSTLAAVIDLINTTKAEHILTIEDPIEFLHQHKKGTIHQRELHSDTPTFSLALRAALRQAPKVILVGEMRDRETIEIAMTAAETGHLVLSTLHTIDASKTVERIVGVFPAADQQAIRRRLAASFRYFVAQRLLPRRDTKGRIAVLEILKATLRTREYVEKGESEGKTLLDAMRDGNEDGMQYFDGEIERLIRERIIEFDTGLAYATNAGNLRLQLADFKQEEPEPEAAPVAAAPA